MKTIRTFLWAVGILLSLMIFLYLGSQDDDVNLMTWLLLLSFIYLLPAIVAFWRQHSSRVAILFLNIMLGWTLLGWVAAMCWALAHFSPAPKAVTP